MGKMKKKGEFGSLWSESLGFKFGTPIMLGPWNQTLWTISNKVHIKMLATSSILNFCKQVKWTT